MQVSGGDDVIFGWSTRPDIAYALHQCARFSHNPKRCHEVGLKHISRYLQVLRIKE